MMKKMLKLINKSRDLDGEGTLNKGTKCKDAW